MPRWSYDKNIWSWLSRLQAHRGYWVEGLQQNSLQSVQEAYKRGFEICEFDVRITADHQVVLFHDDRIGTVHIKKAKLSELRQLTPLTLLSELFDWFITVSDFKLNIEIKSRDLLHSEIERVVCELIKKYELQKRVLISSFNPLTLYKVRLLCPDVYRALLLSYEKEYGNNIFVTSRMLNIFCQPHMLNLRSIDYSGSFAKLAKDIPVTLWTVNEASFFGRRKDEIHGIISDRITPDEFKKI